MADRRTDGGTQWTTARFQEWLEQTAKNEDRSEQEILHRMMASFWVLTEFEDLVGGETSPSLPDLDQSLDAPSGDDPWDILSQHGGPQHGDNTRENAERATESGADPELVRGLVEGFATYLDEHGPSQPDPAHAGETPPEDATVGPSAHQESENTDQAGAPAELANRVDDIEDTVTAVQTRQYDLADDLADLIEDHLSLADTVDELAAEHDELDDAHASLDDRVETDMEKVEQILRRLTEKYRDADETLDHVESTLTSVLEARRTTEHQRERLASLLQSAHSHGIEAGDCEDCGGTIRLGLLTTPRCPHCSKRLVDITPGGWFRSDIIVTGDAQHPTPRTRATSPQSDADQHPPDPHQQSTSSPKDQRPSPDDDIDTTLRPDEDDTDRDRSESFEWADE